jgi:glycosyltransferase involved in cell wall biosynthesis
MPDATRTPLVTVVMPAFNTERYIGESLASIRDQTMRDVEVIVIDDGSTDRTLREAEAFATTLDLTILQQKNAGPSAARNKGIRQARGRYCAFLDADDIMLPELLATQTAMFEAHPEMGLVLTDVTTFDERGVIHAARWGFAERRDGTPLDRLAVENFVTTSAAMAPTARLIEVGLFPEDRRVAEDYDLWLRLAARWPIGLIATPLVRYRYTGGSLSADKMFSARAALEVIEAFWSQNPTYRLKHQDVLHRSMARHLTTAGGAAALRGNRGTALQYLLRALSHEPRSMPTWKWIVKTLILPQGQLAARSRPRPAEATGTAR